MSELKAELKEIRGIGDAKADEIIEVVEIHDTDDTEDETLREAYDYLTQNKTREARRRIEQVLES